MKKVIFCILFGITAIITRAQESLTDYNFLRLPVSAHVAALGGDNITIDDNDPSMIFHNPAMISNVTSKTINLNYMTYMEGTKTASAAFVKAVGEKGTWGVSAQYMDYGDMKEVSADNVETGTFSAKDIMLAGTYSYLLGKRWAGGITAKIISSSIAGYSSLAVGVDLGVNYYDEERNLSLSAVARNLGGQVKAFNDDFERIPFDLQIGISKRLGEAPLRLSATMNKINDWSDSKLTNHLAMGVDIFMSDNIYIAGGYSFRKVNEMKIENEDGSSSHGAGLSLGAGIQMERLKMQVAWGKYHVSTSSLVFNFSYTL